MVKKSVTIFILLLLVLPAISAVEFDMKSNFSQGETLLARVSGNFLDPILEKNVFFYRGHVRVPMEFKVVELEDEFYIYAQLLGKESNNYSVSIEDIRYKSGLETLEDNIVKEFIITNETADFTITPGAIYTNQDFSMEVQNLKDYKMEILIKTTETTTTETSEGFFGSVFEGTAEEKTGTTMEIKSGDTEKIDFTLINFTKSELKTIEFSTDNLVYEIPVFVFLNETIEREGLRAMEFNNPSLNISVSTDSETTRIIYLENIGEEELENITLIISEELEPYINFSTTEIEDIKKNRSEQIDLTILSGTEEEVIQGQITAMIPDDAGNIYAYLDITLNLIKDYVPVNGTEGEPSEEESSKTCAEINGTVCESNQECKGEIEGAKDDRCCIGDCVEKEKSSTGKIIGWIIILCILGFLAWFFMTKYRGAQNMPDIFSVFRRN